MSTAEQKTQPTIEELLRSLSNESLNRYHSSVGSSFTRMLTYIEKISMSGVPKDIKLLLKTYQDMADKFYKQFEFSLLEEIKKQNDVHLKSNDAIAKIKLLTDSGNSDLETTIPFLTKTRDDAFEEQKKLIESFPAQLQNALDKLRQEWQRLNTVAVASKTLAKDEKLSEALQYVVESAKISVGITDRIAIVPGDAFALQFYAYLKNFSILTVPIYSVQAPWEWSIFWHELAGAKAHRLKNDTAIEIDTIREKLVLFHEYFQKKKDKKEVLEIITRNNKYRDYAQSSEEKEQNLSERQNNFSQRYLGRVFSDTKPDLSDLGSLEHQFERMLANLPNENKFTIYEQIKEKGWCVDWFKELFEDAWSVLAIREPFLEFFEDILRRHVATDGIHPPLAVRLEVANELMNLMKSESEAENQTKSVEKIAAEQILKFITLLMAATYKIEPLIDGFDSAWLSEDIKRMLPDLVGNEIGSYIKKRLTDVDTNDPDAESRNYDEFIAVCTSPELKDLVNNLINSNEAQASYADLLKDKETLKDKDYEQLLALSFYDVDFQVGAIDTYQFTLNGTYTITSDKLTVAMTNNWIKAQNPGSWSKITLRKMVDNSILSDFWTTDTHILEDLQTVGNPLIKKIS